MILIRLVIIGISTFLFAIFLVVLAGEVGAWASVLSFLVVAYATYRGLKYSLTRY